MILHLSIQKSDIDYLISFPINRTKVKLLQFPTGIGFEVRDGVYDTPNRTLCSGIIKMIGGSKRLARGYWGDIVCSPYLIHGIFSPLKSMYEVRTSIVYSCSYSF